MNRLVCGAGVMALSAWLLSSAVLAADTNELPPVVKDIHELKWMVGTWVGEQEPLDEDVDGFAKKGDMATMHVTTELLLGNRFLSSHGALHRQGKTLEVFREFWGPRPSNVGVNYWSFSLGMPPFEGQVVQDGDKVIVMVQGEMVAAKVLGPMKKVVDQLGVDKVDYSGEIHFRKIDDETLGVAVHNTKMAGQPVPWPRLGEEMLMHKK